MRLPEYIRQVGVRGFAKAVGESERTVKSWLYMDRQPRPQTALKIVERTPLTMEDIYGTSAGSCPIARTCKQNPNRRKCA
jgi:hypothetical protein